MLNFMAFALTTKCVQCKCHISVLAFLIFYYVVLKLTFYPFFSLTLSDSASREMLKLVLASPELFTFVPWPISVTCQFLFASSVNYMSLETFFFFTLCIKHYFFLHISSAPFKTVKCTLLFFSPTRAAINSWKAHKTANCTLAK